MEWSFRSAWGAILKALEHPSRLKHHTHWIKSLTGPPLSIVWPTLLKKNWVRDFEPRVLNFSLASALRCVALSVSPVPNPSFLCSCLIKPRDSYKDSVWGVIQHRLLQHGRYYSIWRRVLTKTLILSRRTKLFSYKILKFTWHTNRLRNITATLFA